jgi:flagellar basal-body rod protein FlgB
MTESLDNLLQFHANALNVRAFRQQLLAANIANADTPGYKARDIDFASVLRNATTDARSASASLRATSDRHLTGNTGQPTTEVLYRGVLQPSLDGNTVDMDVERNRFAENAVHYDANLVFISNQLKLMQAALQG